LSNPQNSSRDLLDALFESIDNITGNANVDYMYLLSKIVDYFQSSPQPIHQVYEHVPIANDSLFRASVRDHAQQTKYSSKNKQFETRLRKATQIARDSDNTITIDISRYNILDLVGNEPVDDLQFIDDQLISIRYMLKMLKKVLGYELLI